MLLAHTAVLIVGGGFVIGFLVGMTGVGAGALTTPMLISGFGLPPSVAVGTDLLFACTTKASAAWRHQRLGNIDWPVLRWLAAGSLPGAAAVLAWLLIAAPDTQALALAIRKGLAIALLVSAVSIVAYPLLSRMFRRAETAATTADDRALRPFSTLLFGLALGGLVALTSVGAGSLGVTVLTALYPMLAARRIVGTDVVHAIPLTALSGLGHASLGNVDLGVLGLLLVGSIPGIALGSRVTGLLPDWLLRLALAIVMLNAAYLLWLKT